MQSISSWEAGRKRKPWAFPVLCFRLTFKIYCFKMLIIMSDISPVTKWVVTAEGETFFLITFLTAKEGWLKTEQRWGDGSSRRAIRANMLQSVHSYEGGEEGLNATSSHNTYEAPLLNHRVQLVQWHLLTSHWWRLSIQKSTRQDDVTNLK